jgi:hypothetical protein
LRRLLPGYRVTNSTFDEGIYATFLQTDYLPGKIRAFVDFLATNVPGRVRKGGLMPMRSQAEKRVNPQ